MAGFLVVLLFASACGDDAGSTTAAAPETTATTAATTTTTTAPPPTTTEPPADTTTTTGARLPGFGFGVKEPGIHGTRLFSLGFTAQLGEGWFGMSPEARGKIQLAMTDSVERDLDVPYLEFLLAREASTVDEVVAEIEGQADIDVLGVESTSLGGFDGVRVIARMQVARVIGVISQPLEQYGPANEPAMMRFDVIDAGGRTLIVFAEALPDVFDAFIAEAVDPVLATVRFG